MSEIHYDQPKDPLEAAQEAGVQNIAQFLANSQDPEKPWIIYGAGTVVDSTTINPDTLAKWRSTGRITVSAEVDVPVPPTPPVITDVVATPSPSDGTQASIAWTTDLDSDSQVNYGLDEALGTSSALDPTPTKSHTVALTGLTEGTLYHYIVLSGGVTSPDATFNTLPPA